MELSELKDRAIESILDPASRGLDGLLTAVTGFGLEQRRMMGRVDNHLNRSKEAITFSQKLDGIQRVIDGCSDPEFATKYRFYKEYRVIFYGPGDFPPLGLRFSDQDCNARGWGEFTIYDHPYPLDDFRHYLSFIEVGETTTQSA